MQNNHCCEVQAQIYKYIYMFSYHKELKLPHYACVRPRYIRVDWPISTYEIGQAMYQPHYTIKPFPKRF